MIFLFEQIAYETKFLKKVLPQKEGGANWNLPKGFVQKESNGLRKLDGVGYLYNSASEYATEEKDPSHKMVFVLPKVFIEEDEKEKREQGKDEQKIFKAFGNDIPKSGNFTFDKSVKNFPKKFLSNLSLWVCSSIGQYRLLNPNDKDIDVPDAPDAYRFNSKPVPTLIDVKNAMKRFYYD